MINEQLLKIIKDKGVSLTYLARQTGISKQNLSRILNTSDIKWSQLEKIIRALDITLNELTNNPFANEDEVKELKNQIESQRKEIRFILENSVSIKKINELASKIESKALAGKGLIYLEFDNLSNNGRFFFAFAPLKEKITENEMNDIVNATIVRELDNNLEVKGYQIE